MTIYTTQQLKDRCKALGLQWPTKIHIVGIRNKSPKPNEFNDNFYLCNGDSRLFLGQGTTIPGTYWLLNLLNVKGTAVLKADASYNYKLGLHNGYEALVQAGPVTVFRDNDKDLIAEETNVLDTGWFGINIHRAGKNFIAKFIDKFSAGCQVWQDPVLFGSVIELIKSSKQPIIPYTLLKEF